MKNLILILFLFILSEVRGQDPVFTQFYASPTILNPAFAGSRNSTRFSAGYRNQWRGVNSKINTFYASGDGFVGPINSGVGVNLINQKEELTNYSYTQINLLYSFHVKLNDDWSLFPGMSFGYAFKQFDFGGLLFEDQIDLITGNINPTNDEFFEKQNINFFDLSAGMVLYHTNAWIGLSLKHLTNPDISFIEGEELPLEMFFSVHGGYRFTLRPDDRYSQQSNGTHLFLTANYMHQGPYDRIDLGAEFEISSFFIGLLSSATVNSQIEGSDTFLSISPITGLEFDKFKIGLSYDFPVSSIGNNAGTAEITLQYDLGNTYVRRRRWQVKN
jgi:type IX secretion system PorP/SprF family membrane protein